MNLYSVSWEVIHMTSRTIRGPPPQSIRGQSMYFIIPPFFFVPSPWETAHQKHGHLRASPQTRSQPNCMFPCTLFSLHVLSFFFIPEKCAAHRQPSSPRSHPSELHLTLEESCGPAASALTLDESKALLSSGVGLIRHTVRLTGERLRGPCSSVLLSLTGIYQVAAFMCHGLSESLCFVLHRSISEKIC